MRLVYRDIYIREKVIFEGETLEYQIEEEEDGVRKTKEKGEISCREIPGRSRESRFAALNEMSLSLKVNNGDGRFGKRCGSTRREMRR